MTKRPPSRVANKNALQSSASEMHLAFVTFSPGVCRRTPRCAPNLSCTEPVNCTEWSLPPSYPRVTSRANSSKTYT